MIATMFLAADILGLGHSISSFGQTLALSITFIFIGVIANVLIIYAVVQVLAERRQNQERMAAYDSSQPHESR
jgi:NADH:ubiquinone oxidoreductase subunit 3 (subunit A)